MPYKDCALHCNPLVLAQTRAANAGAMVLDLSLAGATMGSYGHLYATGDMSMIRGSSAFCRYSTPILSQLASVLIIRCAPPPTGSAHKSAYGPWKTDRTIPKMQSAPSRLPGDRRTFSQIRQTCYAEGPTPTAPGHRGAWQHLRSCLRTPRYHVANTQHPLGSAHTTDRWNRWKNRPPRAYTAVQAMAADADCL